MSVPHNSALACGISFAAVVTIVGIYFYKRQKPWKKVGFVTKLFFHPVKSMRGVDSINLMCLKQGLREADGCLYDRGFLVVQPGGNMMTARREPRLVAIDVKKEKKFIIFSTPSKSSIKVLIPQDDRNAQHCRVWGGETTGIDCGDEVAEWLSDYLGSEYRLYYHPHGVLGRDISIKEDRPASFFGKMYYWTGNVKYQNSAPCHLLSEASIEDLNTRLDDKVTARSFRPNIVIGGCKPYEEDNWTCIRIGDAVFKYVRNCFRCVITTVDPDTGKKSEDGNPLKKLKEYRLCKPKNRSFYGDSPLFGISLAVVKEGRISVGDQVYAL